MIAPDFDTAFAEFVTARQDQAMAAQATQFAAERQLADRTADAEPEAEIG